MLFLYALLLSSLLLLQMGCWWSTRTFKRGDALRIEHARYGGSRSTALSIFWCLLFCFFVRAMAHGAWFSRTNIIIVTLLEYLYTSSLLNLPLLLHIMMAAGEDFMQMDSQETAIMMQQDSQETNATIIGRTNHHRHENHDQHEGNAAMDDDTSSLVDSNTAPAHDSPQAVIASIEALVACILEQLDRNESPLLSSQNVTRRLTLSQSRSFTSICMVLSFSHSLLLSGRTTTTREVYYFFVTHFRSQKECDSAILDACNLLNVPRSSLGLYASPKGKYLQSLLVIVVNHTGTNTFTYHHNHN